jgi:hypothetical protein
MTYLLAHPALKSIWSVNQGTALLQRPFRWN